MNTMTDIAGEEAEPLDESFAAAEARLRALARLTEIGMSLAEMTHGRAVAQMQVIPSAHGDRDAAALRGLDDFGLMFAKIARSVRLTIGLEERLEKALRDRKAGLEVARRERALKAAEAEAARVAEAAAAVQREAEAPRRERQAAIEDAMLEIIQRQIHNDWDEVFRLSDEVEGLLEDEHGDYENFDQRPVSETLARLCDELGLRPEWNRWAKTDWAIEEAEAGVEGSPYVKPAGPDESPAMARAPGAADSS